MDKMKLQAIGDSLTACLLTDAPSAIHEIVKAGPIPASIRFAGTSGAVIQAVLEGMKNDAAPTTKHLRAVSELKGDALEKVINYAPLTTQIRGLVKALREHDATERAAGVLRRDDSSIACKRHDVDVILGQVDARTMHAEGNTVDAAAWLADPDDPEEPIIHKLFDVGDRVSIVGQSKARKSFYAMQMAVSIAAGIPFLGADTVRQTVLLVNGEIRKGWYRRRLRRMVDSLLLDPQVLEDRLIIVNSCDDTGATWDSVLTEATRRRAGVCMVDPAYLLLGDEIDQIQAKENVRAMKQFAAEGITLVCVYHATKGHIGDRQVIDRVSGSGIYARDATTMISLCEHASEENHAVVSSVTRNHPPSDARAIVFENGAFFESPDVGAVEKTSKTQAARKFSDEDVASCFSDQQLSYADQTRVIQNKLSIGIVNAKAIITRAVEARIVAVVPHGRTHYYSKR